MPTLFATVGAAGLLLIATPAAWAQNPAQPADAGKDVAEVVRLVDEATKKVQHVAYDYEVFGIDALEDQIARQKGSVKLMKASSMDDSPFWVSVQGPESAEPIVVLASDGATAYLLDMKDKVFRHGKIGQGADVVVQKSRPAAMIEYVHPTPFSDEMNADSLKYEGTKEIGEVLCDVVYVVYENAMAEARWYFGQEDHLPRRVERISDDGMNQGAMVTEIHALNTEIEVGKDNFILKAPEGFRTEEFAKPRPVEALAVGSKAPDWSLQTPEGKTVQLSDLRGKVVLMDFWATWCGPCKKAMPHIQAIHERFKDQPVEVYGIAVWQHRDPNVDPVQGPADYMKENNYTYGLVVQGDEAAKAYKVNAIPTLAVVGKDGKLLHIQTGMGGGEDALVAIIEKALKAEDM